MHKHERVTSSGYVTPHKGEGLGQYVKTTLMKLGGVVASFSRKTLHK